MTSRSESKSLLFLRARAESLPAAEETKADDLAVFGPLQRVLRLEALAEAHLAALDWRSASGFFHQLAEARDALAAELEERGDPQGAALERWTRNLDGWTFGEPLTTSSALRSPRRRLEDLPMATFAREAVRWAMVASPPESWLRAFEKAETRSRRNQRQEAAASEWKDGREAPVEEDLEAAYAAFWLGDMGRCRKLATAAFRGVKGWPSPFRLPSYEPREAMARARGLVDLLDGIEKQNARRLSSAEERLLQAMRAPSGADHTADRLDLVVLIVIARRLRDDPLADQFLEAFPGASLPYEERS